jgi:16S rRNA (guanine527-N7)-methyltransferase
MTAISDAKIEELLRPYGVTPIPGIHAKIGVYISLLLKWNRSISLTTVIDPVEIVKFHFGESLFASTVADFEDSRLADVGSGAGFPGIPLAMQVRSLNLTLIESNTKKCAFLSEVTRELDISTIRVFRGRMEDFPAKSGFFGFIAARALGHHGDLLAWSRAHLTASGKLVLWLGDEDATILSRTPDWDWDDRVAIPGSKRRFLLLGSPKT